MLFFYRELITFNYQEAKDTGKKINLSEGEQHTPEFLAISANGRIPAIVDRDNDDLSIFESGAIMIYLAEKTNKLMPTDTHEKSKVIQWLMFQMGGIGPIFGQVHHFKRAAKEKVPYAINRYFNECRRLYGVLDSRLAGRKYIANDEVSIADFCTVPWVFRHDWQEIDLDEFKNVKRWYDNMMQRPALTRGMNLPD